MWRRVRHAFRALPTVLVLSAGIAAAQPVLSRQDCRSVAAGPPFTGLVQVEDWTAEAGTHRLYGLFADGQGNRYEFEVFTNQPEGGVGGLWVNGMRHRETHVRVETRPGGVTVTTEDGLVVVLECG